MTTYLIPIKTALFIYPLLAVLFTFPYLVIQYRKYGTISFLKTVIFNSFMFYLLCMYFLVILPLPSVVDVINSTAPMVQLKPFQFVNDFLRETEFVLSDPHTYIPALTQNCFLQVIFNILLFVPFGIYIRYYFHFSFKKVAILSFLLSLFFELTQLSGLYGMYPKPYRLFDIDDLFLNTCGGMLGYPLGYFAIQLLPGKENLKEKGYETTLSVSFFQRFIAVILDSIIFLTFALITTISISTVSFIMILYVTKGYTPGKWLLRIHIVNQRQTPPSFIQCIFRIGILIFGFIYIPYILLPLLFIDFYFNRKTGRLFYERLTKTNCIRTIQQFSSYSGTIKLNYSNIHK